MRELRAAPDQATVQQPEPHSQPRLAEVVRHHPSQPAILHQDPGGCISPAFHPAQQLPTAPVGAAVRSLIHHPHTRNPLKQEAYPNPVNRSTPFAPYRFRATNTHPSHSMEMAVYPRHSSISRLPLAALAGGFQRQFTRCPQHRGRVLKPSPSGS